MTVVVGPSGSGKSTLLSLLACTQRPDEGTVRIGETDVLALSSRARREIRRDRLGIVLPQPSENLLDQFDAAANVHWAASQRRQRSEIVVEAASEIDELLDSCRPRRRQHAPGARALGRRATTPRCCMRTCRPTGVAHPRRTHRITRPGQRRLADRRAHPRRRAGNHDGRLRPTIPRSSRQVTWSLISITGGGFDDPERRHPLRRQPISPSDGPTGLVCNPSRSPSRRANWWSFVVGRVVASPRCWPCLPVGSLRTVVRWCASDRGPPMASTEPGGVRPSCPR